MTGASFSELLSNRPNAAPLSEDTRDWLTKIGKPVTLLVGDTLDLTGVCLVAQGTGKLWWTLPNGAEHICSFTRLGSLLLGEYEFASNLRLSALEPMKLIVIQPSELVARAGCSAARSLELIAAAAAQITALQVHAAMLARMAACERVAAFLLAPIHDSNSDCGDGSLIHLPMSRAEIGDHLGLTIETVSRCFSVLKSHGFIACPARQQVSILNRKGLADYCERA